LFYIILDFLKYVSGKFFLETLFANSTYLQESTKNKLKKALYVELLSTNNKVIALANA